MTLTRSLIVIGFFKLLSITLEREVRQKKSIWFLNTLKEKHLVSKYLKEKFSVAYL